MNSTHQTGVGVGLADDCHDDDADFDDDGRCGLVKRARKGWLEGGDRLAHGRGQEQRGECEGEDDIEAFVRV